MSKFSELSLTPKSYDSFTRPLYIYIYIYIHMYIYIHTHAPIYIYIYRYTHTLTHTHTYTFFRTLHDMLSYCCRTDLLQGSAEAAAAALVVTWLHQLLAVDVLFHGLCHKLVQLCP